MRFIVPSLIVAVAASSIASPARSSTLVYNMETVVGSPSGVTNVLDVDPALDRGRFAGGAVQSNTQVKFGSFSTDLTASNANLNNANSNITPGSEFTVMAHVYLNSNGGDHAIASQWSGGWLFEVLNGNLNFQTTGGSQQVSAGVGTGQWYHTAITFDNGVLKFFVDGVQVGGDFDVSGTIGTSVSGNGGNLNVGNFLSGGAALDGYMDDFFFDNSVLSGSDIAFYNENTITIPVPEPSSLGLLLMGALAMMPQRRKK